MTADQARLMADFFITVIEHEIPTTMKILQAVPEEKRDYRPAEGSRSALELARHLPAGELWFLEGLISGEFTMPDSTVEDATNTVAGAIKLYEDKVLPAVEKVKALPGERLAKKMSLLGLFEHPSVIFLSFLIRHTVHHRGQLSAYLRPMGAKVPAIYGGSADEPFDPASASKAARTA